AALPVLLTRYEIPFVALARTVAASNRLEEQDRLTRTLRVYGHLKRRAGDDSLSDLLQALTGELRCPLYLVNTEDARSLLPGIDLPPQLRQQVTKRKPPPEQRPAVLRLDGTPGALAVPVPGPRPTTLVAIPDRDVRLDISVLQHAAAVVALRQTAEAAHRDHERAVGTSLLAQLIDGQLDIGGVAQLVAKGVNPPVTVLATSGAVADAAADHLHHWLADHRIGHLQLTRAGVVYTLVPSRELPAPLVTLCPPDAHTGVSTPIDDLAQTPEAKRQAHWAMHRARMTGQHHADYSQAGLGSPFLPGDLEGGREAALRVLGALLRYDDSNDGVLVPSLHVFLEENRSWLRAATRLHVHKQTLVYRMRRVEQVTGRQLDVTSDVCDLWFALQCAIECGLITV
ncbi:MAG TPA: helix-turn-helix domain-containing protein, partial [Micromonospora sp.]|nr:helix-turn-helix domain-containing protein [Micromonospora sp.]